MTKSAQMRALFAEGRTVSEVSDLLAVDYAFAYGVAKRAGYASTAARRRGVPAVLRPTVSGRSATEINGPAGQSSRGPRVPRIALRPVRYEGEPIRIKIAPGGQSGPDGPPALVIEGAQWLAETFFRRDPSAVGPRSYDAWIDETQASPVRRDTIVDEDITAINRTMATRSPHKTWAPVIASSDWSWLNAIDEGWDLFEMPPADWSKQKVAEHITRAFGAIRRKGLGIAVTTKVLHIKRPRLIPVLDSLVLARTGSRVTNDVETWMTAMESVRRVGQENLDDLRTIRGYLAEAGLPERTLVRILDALLWTASPGSALFSNLDGWEHVLRRSPMPGP